MNINSACILEDRGILFVDGEDAKDFLQNIITNDINKVTNANSCFASLLTPQGKFLFDFLVTSSGFLAVAITFQLLSENC